MDMEDYILISSLNDFVFCPYSIYLHNVYMEADEDLYHAYPQTRGRIAHESVDKRTYSSRKADIVSLPVFSERLGLMGKIDVYRQNEHILVEKKYQLKQIYRGQLYQLWAEYFCMVEMGYHVKGIAFYEICSNKTMPIQLPGNQERSELENIIDRYRSFTPDKLTEINMNKCAHCIYNNLCDKTTENNVY